MNRPLDLAGQTAVVVGAAHGIGAAVTTELRTRGAHVVAVDQSPDVVRIAEGAPDSALLPRIRSMNGAPRNIHRKHGMNVTQVASRPPSVPASRGASMPG